MMYLIITKTEFNTFLDGIDMNWEYTGHVSQSKTTNFTTTAQSLSTTCYSYLSKYVAALSQSSLLRSRWKESLNFCRP